MKSLALDLRFCPSAEMLMETAWAQTDLDDFGDPALQEGLRVFVSSMAKETWQSMALRAREFVVDYLIHHLGTRLWLVDDRKCYPEIARQDVGTPLIVVGPLHSGGTLLHRLLSFDPQAMSPEHWICREPSPPLAKGAPSCERLERAERLMMGPLGLIPGGLVAHPYVVDQIGGAFAECGSDILNLASTSQEMWRFWGGESYRRYLLEAEHEAALDFHHDFLQHIQWGRHGCRWVLKSPDHGLWLNELARRYPNALLIWTHRDLSEQVPAIAGVQGVLRGLNGHPKAPQSRYTDGRKAIAHQRDVVRKAMAAREAIGEARFIDVSYHELAASPVETIARIYERAGLTVAHDHAVLVRAWMARNERPTEAGNAGWLAEFDLDPAAINRDFADYIARFGYGFGIRPNGCA